MGLPFRTEDVEKADVLVLNGGNGSDLEAGLCLSAWRVLYIS